MYENIKIEKIKDCMAESQMDIFIYDEEIEKYRDKLDKINKIGFILVYSIIIFSVILSLSINVTGFILIILLTILGIIPLFLYNYFILEKFIKPIYKNLYEKGYYITGHVEIDGIITRIDNCTYDISDTDKLLDEMIKEYQETKKSKK